MENSFDAWEGTPASAPWEVWKNWYVFCIMMVFDTGMSPGEQQLAVKMAPSLYKQGLDTTTAIRKAAVAAKAAPSSEKRAAEGALNMAMAKASKEHPEVFGDRGKSK